MVEYAVTQMLDYFQDYKKMHTLTISRCVKVTDFSIIEIVRSMPNIVCLNLEGLRGLTDNALRHIARSPLPESTALMPSQALPQPHEA